MFFPEPIKISPSLIDEARRISENNTLESNLFLENGIYNIKNLGTVHTPPNVVRYILDSIGYSPERCNDTKILDISCGTGSFTFEIASSVHKHLLEIGYNKTDYEDAKKIIDAITKHIYSFDINSLSTLMTAKRLISVIYDEIELIREYDEGYIPNLNIFKENSLLSLYNQNIKFDYVVSNPPYVRYNEIDKSLIKTYKGLYNTSSGKYDLYALFFELGINLLKQNGKLGYITPNRYFSTDYAKPLRKQILSTTNIEKLVDFEEIGLFKNIHTYPVVTILSKTKRKSTQKNTFPYIHIKGNLTEEVIDITSLNFESYCIKQSDLTDNVWSFLPTSINSIKKKLNSAFPRLNDLPISVRVGVATGIDEVFLLQGNDFDIEDELLFPIIKGKDIGKCNIKWNRTYLLNPYLEGGKPINLDEYPLAKKYLESKKEKMVNKYHVKQGKKWYETHDPINLKKELVQRIVGPSIAKHSRFSVENGEFLCHNSCYSFFYNGNLNLLTSIMNSKLFEFELKTSLPKINGGFWRQTKSNIMNLSMIDPEIFDPIEIEVINSFLKNEEWDDIDELMYSKTNLTKKEIEQIEKYLNKDTH